MGDPVTSGRFRFASQPREFVAALAGLAHELGLEIVAEFVSDEETQQFLGEQGVEYAQGFYLGQPEEFPASLRE